MGEKILLLVVTTLDIHGIAFLLVPMFRDWLRKAHGIPEDYRKQIERENPHYDRLNVTVGILERIFFTVVVACNISGSIVAMMAWASLKMLTGWNRSFPKEQENKEKDISIDARTKMAFCSLYTGLISLFFALISGLVIRWFIEWIK